MKKLIVILLLANCQFLFVNSAKAQSLSVSVIVTANVTCYGGSNGSISSISSGGTTPYTYSWSPGGEITPIASNLTAGTYTILLTDYLGLTVTASATVTQPASLTASCWAKYSAVCGGQSDSLFASGGGGTVPYYYAWSGPLGDLSCYNCQNINAYPYGLAYIVTAVNDLNGCTASASVSITVHPFPYVTITGPINPIAPGRSDTLIATGAGITSYLWSNSSTKSAIKVSPSIPTTYSVVVTNMYSCYDTAHYTIDTNSVGNGSSSSNAIRIVPSTTINMASFSTKDSEAWFSFIPTDSNAQIISNSAYLSMPVPHVHRLTLYNGSLGMMVDEPMPDITGANQIRIDISHLDIGSTYYVRAARTPAHSNMAGCNPSATGECNPSQRWDFQMGIRTVPVFVPQDSGSEPPSVNQLYYEDRGQIADLNDIPRFDIKAYTNSASPTIYASDSAVSFVYTRIDTGASAIDSTQRVDMVLAGSSVQPSQPVFKMEEDSNAGYLNYFKEFIKNGVPKVEGYSRLVYKNVYPNVDMQVYSNTLGTKLYFICNPGTGTGGSGGNPANIELQFNGATAVNVTLDGSLNVVTKLGTLSFAPGYAYTDSAGVIKPKSWQPYFVAVNSNTVKFNTGSFNTNEPLIIRVDRGHLSSLSGSCIDNLCWSTYFGGTNSGDVDVFRGVTHDMYGNIFAVGFTTSVKFPVFRGIQIPPGGDNDAVAVEFSGSNYSRSWATYYGGSGDDVGYGIAADSVWGNVYITGSTNSVDLPMPRVYNGGYAQNGLNGTRSGSNTDAFIAKISFGGQFLSWATWYGGAGNEVGYGIAVDTTSPHNNLYVVGTGDVNTPLYDELGSYYDSTSGTGLILKFNTTGLWEWATLIGSDSTVLNGCTVDAGNNLYITGTSGSGYPVSGGRFSFKRGAYDAVATKFNTSNAIAWSTYYGGDGEDYGNAITTDASGNAYITGYTLSPYSSVPIELAKPHSWSYYQDTNGDGIGEHPGEGNAFIAEFASSDGTLLWGTYFGGGNDIEGDAITMDANQNLYLTGDAGHYALIWPANQPAGAYVRNINIFTFDDVFIAAFNPSGGYYWGTYLGSVIDNDGYGITAYNAKNLYIVGGALWSYVFVNPGGGAWYQDSISIPLGSSTTAYISEFNIAGITTGENELKVESGELKVYPNPTLQNVTLQMNLEQSENVEYIIYNLLGEPVYSDMENEHAGTVNKQISLSSLPNGNYIIEVIAGSNIYHAKITKLQ